MAKVLVTGGAGFIGSHVWTELERKGHEPVVLDMVQWEGKDRWRGDVTVAEAWWAKDYEDVDAVIHLAGVLGTSELFDNPMGAVDANIKGAIHALQFCRERGARYVAITMPDCWANVYQATKHCAARLASAWHQAFGVPVTHVRAFNVYGQGQKPGYPQKIIPTFSVAAAKGKPIPIWGEGYQYVDLISAEDVAKVLVAGVEAPGLDETIDAGTATGHAVRDVAVNCWTTLRPGEQPLLEFHPMRPGETSAPRTATIATGAGWKHLKGWQPKWDQEHFERVVRWYGSNYGR